jgi:hypothetical protein
MDLLPIHSLVHHVECCIGDVGGVRRDIGSKIHGV